MLAAGFLTLGALSAPAADTQPPAISSVTPAPGTLSSLTELRVLFNEPVVGIDAADLWVNGVPARSVSGALSVYTFSFEQPVYGQVEVTWFAGHGIVDRAVPPNAFEEASISWRYELVDNLAPVVARVTPPAGALVRQLSQIEVAFSEPVTGISAADMLVGGQGAARAVALSDSSFRFEFPPAAPGRVEVQWAADHRVADLAEPPNEFGGGAWNYQVDPFLIPGDLVITEFQASNTAPNGLKDEEGEPQDWIEIFNRGATPVNLEGWALTDDPREPGQWLFPAVALPSRQYLVVFASGKDRRSGPRLHTNFRLSTAGEYLGLYTAELPRRAASELAPAYPEQRHEYSYGLDAHGGWRYFKAPTPGLANGLSAVEGIAEPPHFSVERGYFSQPFQLTLASEAEDARLRFTLDGSEPTETRGLEYTGPIEVRSPAVVRAAAFRSNQLPSKIVTHTYLVGLPANRRSLPALSIVTATNNLFGSTGIMETNPRNTTKRGIAWERPASVELIEPADNDGFQIDCGLRVQGGDYVRQRYNPRGSLPFSKYSFRLYFRGDYGAGKLRYPLFAGSPVQEFDRLVLRAGMNDHSNPFIVDELVRRMMLDTGQVTVRGTFVLLFINGVYKGYYNPTEGYEEDFFRAWHGGGDRWDIIAQFGEIAAGDATAWSSLRSLTTSRDLTVPANYEQVSKRLDLTNFVDYLLVNIYGGTGDWPNNNWRAARERVAGSRFRYYVWDAEWALGNQGRSVSLNTLTGELANNSDVAQFYRALRRNPEFRLLFADRVQKHFFNGGALTDARITNHYNLMRAEMAGILPGMSTAIPRIWVPRRRNIIMNHMRAAGLIASNAPAFNPHGGPVPLGHALRLAAPAGTIYFTTNGADPRVAGFGTVAPDAATYAVDQPIVLTRDMVVRARTLHNGQWSALEEAAFVVGSLGVPIRITEINYHPPGGDAYEFIELQNIGGLPVDLGHMAFAGITFSFREGTIVPPGGIIVLGSDLDMASFALRYPAVRAAGFFSGNLSNAGERLALLDHQGRTVVSVDFDDEPGWPLAADGAGKSLEILDPAGDPDSAANWQASAVVGGSPGRPNASPAAPEVRLNEVMTENTSFSNQNGAYPDWVELHNPSAGPVNLSGWSLSDDGEPQRYVLPQGTSLAPGGFLVIWCDRQTDAPGYHAGFGLSRNGEMLALYDAGTNRIDAVDFGPQAADYSLGRLGAAGGWEICVPTPGSANGPAPMAAATNLVINEWMANPAPGAADWLELFNRAPGAPLLLRGFYLAASDRLFQVTSLVCIPPQGYLRLWADEKPGPDHLDWKLPASGGAIILYDPAGAELDRVNYGPQSEGVSQGRLPDGSAVLAQFTSSASPGARNYLPGYQGPILNEVMARNLSRVRDSSGRPADWIELYNPSSQTVSLAGMSISVENPVPGQWVFPPGSVVTGNSYLVIWCDNSQPASAAFEAELNIGRALEAEGGAVYLFDAGREQADSIEYGFQVRDLSIGRSAGQWQLLAEPTPGEANSLPAPLGAPADLRLNEWLANPVAGEDWLELYHSGLLPVDLSGLVLTDDPSIAGQTRFVIKPLAYVGARDWVRWIADGSVSRGRDHLNFSLDTLGETVRLYGPDGQLLDSVALGVQLRGVSEGRTMDGGPVIDFLAAASPASGNAADRDGDGLPDAWEEAHGLNPGWPGDALLDSDGDGALNSLEFQSGTNPQDAGEAFRFEEIAVSFEQVRLGFRAMAGKRYLVQARDALAPGTFWQILEETPPPRTSRRVDVLDPNSAGGNARFYRLMILPRP